MPKLKANQSKQVDAVFEKYDNKAIDQLTCINELCKIGNTAGLSKEVFFSPRTYEMFLTELRLGNSLKTAISLFRVDNKDMQKWLKESKELKTSIEQAAAYFESRVIKATWAEHNSAMKKGRSSSKLLTELASVIRPKSMGKLNTGQDATPPPPLKIEVAGFKDTGSSRIPPPGISKPVQTKEEKKAIKEYAKAKDTVKRQKCGEATAKRHAERKAEMLGDNPKTRNLAKLYRPLTEEEKEEERKKEAAKPLGVTFA